MFKQKTIYSLFLVDSPNNGAQLQALRTQQRRNIDANAFMSVAAPHTMYRQNGSEESSHIASTLSLGCIHAVEKHELGGCGPNRPKLKLSLVLGFFDFCDVATVVGDVGEGPKAGKPKYHVTVTQ